LRTQRSFPSAGGVQSKHPSASCRSLKYQAESSAWRVIVAPDGDDPKWQLDSLRKQP
jgi:hypothetical protein